MRSYYRNLAKERPWVLFKLMNSTDETLEYHIQEHNHKLASLKAALYWEETYGSYEVNTD